MTIAVINSGGANLGSVQHALNRLGAESVLTKEADAIRAADKVILPGVGAAAWAMNALREAQLVETIQGLTRPVLGICLGLQLMFESSEEGEVDCLGLIPGRVRKLRVGDDLRLPHMGWNQLDWIADDPLTAGLDGSEWFYFVHGFAAPTTPWRSVNTASASPPSCATGISPPASSTPKSPRAPAHASCAAFLKPETPRDRGSTDEHRCTQILAQTKADEPLPKTRAAGYNLTARFKPSSFLSVFICVHLWTRFSRFFMELIPAIDLRGGRVVRLQQGDYERETRYDDDALVVAKRYADAGATLIHVVDLDSARDGGSANLAAIERLCREVDAAIQTGGGVRSQADYQRRLDAGAARVVIGSLCVREPELIEDWLGRDGGDRIVAGLDVSPGVDGGWMPRASGWTESGSTDLFTLLARLAEAGLRHLLCTDIERDGMFAGPSLDLYESICARFSALAVQASGGIGSAADLGEVAQTGVAGCIVGRALLEGRVELGEIARWSR
jgi:phosphoribosylformimino-5-aminoimidazole carboxamide ribotide isomerase